MTAVVDEGDEVYLETRLPDAFDKARPASSPERISPVRFVDADFEDPDGSPAVLDTDLVGDRKIPGQTYPAGPLGSLSSGDSRIRVW